MEALLAVEPVLLQYNGQESRRTMARSLDLPLRGPMDLHTRVCRTKVCQGRQVRVVLFQATAARIHQDNTEVIPRKGTPFLATFHHNQ